MSWKNIIKGQKAQDDPRIQGFLARQKSELRPGEAYKLGKIKELNVARMELAEKMLDQDGYIDMMGFFDEKVWGVPLSYADGNVSNAWITKDMFEEGEYGYAFDEMYDTTLNKVPSIIRYGMIQTIDTWDEQGERTVEKLTDEEVSYKNQNLWANLKKTIIDIKPHLDKRKLVELMLSDEDPNPKLKNMVNKLKMEAKSQFEQNYPDGLKRISFEEFLDSYRDSYDSKDGIGKLKELFNLEVEQFDSNTELPPLIERNNIEFKHMTPFYFRGWLWQKIPKNKKLEMFRKLLPSEKGGTIEPPFSGAKPTHVEEEMLDGHHQRSPYAKGSAEAAWAKFSRQGLGIHGSRKPSNADSGEFPMEFAREPFGSNINVKKSWYVVLKK